MERKRRTAEEIVGKLRQAEMELGNGPSVAVACKAINEHWFLSLDGARAKVEAWRRHYNHDRPHRALGSLAPREFAASSGQACLAG